MPCSCKSVRPTSAGAIDVHNHFYPPSYLEELKKGRGAATVTEDKDGNYILTYEGDYNVIVPGHRDIEFRREELDRAGIRAQILSLTTPGTHIETTERGIRLAKMTNDDFAAITQRFPGRFYGFAALPLQDPGSSARELERAVKELGLKGGTLFTNVNGKTLDDPSYEELFKTARELDAPLFVHPTTPIPSDAFLDYRLAATVGFTVDTTLAVARLIFSGVLDRVPGLKLIASHLGGCLPYLAERLDRGWAAYPECKKASRAPSSYIREIYIDCVSFEPLAVDFARKLLGAWRLMVGSDYPHQIGDLYRCTEVIGGLEAPEGEKTAILSGNAVALLGL
ncbi:MAG: amidohydrolase family protein [Firmicutes bacterium]|nr:amidohydrolase family protein [Bacillota bacterium]